MKQQKFKTTRKHNWIGYSENSMQRTYAKAKLTLYGNKATIIGSVDDDYNSCDAV